MSPQLRQRIAAEADLVDRFTEFYHRKFQDLIGRLNASAEPVDPAQSLRLCVEAVDMMITMQNQMARALRDLARSPSPGTPVSPFRRAA